MTEEKKARYRIPSEKILDLAYKLASRAMIGGLTEDFDHSDSESVSQKVTLFFQVHDAFLPELQKQNDARKTGVLFSKV